MVWLILCATYPLTVLRNVAAWKKARDIDGKQHVHAVSKPHCYTDSRGRCGSWGAASRTCTYLADQSSCTGRFLENNVWSLVNTDYTGTHQTISHSDANWSQLAHCMASETRAMRLFARGCSAVEGLVALAGLYKALCDDAKVWGFCKRQVVSYASNFKKMVFTNALRHFEIIARSSLDWPGT
jgi:hypothetical protein